MSQFQLVGLDHTQFAPLFDLTDDELKSQGIVRTQATKQPGYPCRISLEDAVVGEEILLLPFWHHDVNSPYRSLGPIYIRKGVTQALLPPGEVPDYVSTRVISLRAYDPEHMMVGADVCSGDEIAMRLSVMFDDHAISYIQLHNAKQGCYSCLAERLSGP